MKKSLITENSVEIYKQQRRIAFTAAILVVVVGIVIAFVTISPLYQNLNQLQQTRLIDNVKLQGQTIDQYLSELGQITIQITTRTKAREKLEAYNLAAVTLIDTQTFLAPLLRDPLERYGSMLGITRFDIQKNPVISIGQPVPEELWSFGPYSNIKYNIMGPVNCGHLPCLVVSAPILDRDDKLVGTDIVSFEFSTLSNELINSLDTESYGNTLLVTAGNTPQILFNTLLELHDSIPLITSESTLSLMIANVGLKESGLFEFNDVESNLDYLVSFQRIGETGWILFNSVKSENFYVPIFKQIFSIAVIIFIILLISLLAMYVLLRPISQKLNDSTRSLIKSEEKYRTLVENSPYCIHEINRDFKLISMNPAGLQLMGLELENQVTGMEYLDAVSKPDRARIKGLMISAFEGNASEFEFTSVNNSIFQSSFIPIYEKDGQIVRLMGLTIDITGKKQTERYLQFTNFAIEKTQDAIYWIRPDASFFYVNQAACNMLGYTNEELLMMNIFDIDPDFSREDLVQAWKVLEETGSNTLETRHCTKDGRIFPIEVRSHFLEYEGIAYNCAVVRDISKQKAAIRKEKDLQEQLQLAVKSGNVGLWDWDLLTNKVFYSQEWKHQIGYEENEISSDFNEWQYRVHPDDLEATLNKVNDYLESPWPDYQIEFRFRHKDGTYRWILAQGELQFSEDGKPSRMIGSHIDITSLKNTEQDLQKTQDNLRNLVARLRSAREEERARISREIHDELGQSLTGLRIDLTWILEHIPKGHMTLDERTKTALQLVNKTIKSMQRLAYELRPSMLDDLGLGAAIEWQLNEFKRRTGCRFNLEMDFNGIDLNDNRDTAIFRIVQEALTNISRHANASRVKLSLRVNNGWMELEISDNGKGLDLEVLNSTDSIGLIGMRERAESLGGKIDFRLQQSGGTAISLDIPLRSN